MKALPNYWILRTESKHKIKKRDNHPKEIMNREIFNKM